MNARFSSIIVCFALLACLALAQVHGKTVDDCAEIDFNNFGYKPPEGKSWFDACQECCELADKDIGNFVGGAQCKCSMKDPDFSI